MARTSRFAAVVFVLVFAPLLGAHPGHDDGPVDEVFKVGKNGDVKIGHDVAIGDLVLSRGRYRFEHRIEAERHTIVLTAIGRKDGSERVYEIPMRLMSSREVAKRSAIFAKEAADHSLRLTIVQVAGESVDHVPERRVAATP